MHIVILRLILKMENFDENGEFDEERYILDCAKQQINMMDQFMCHIISSTRTSRKRQRMCDEPPRVRKRRVKSIPILLKNIDGVEHKLLPRETFWYLRYIAHPITDIQSHKIFWRRFRLPIHSFFELVGMLSCDNMFKRWISKDCVKKESTPIELLLLVSLRYLGRGWTFDDLEEQTAISRENHRQFFHTFIKFGSTFLFEKYVNAPLDADIAKLHGHEFNLAGIHGAIGSTDATHIAIKKIQTGYTRCIKDQS